MCGSNFYVPLPDYLSAIVAGLDVDVLYIDLQGNIHNIHSSHFHQPQNQEEWLSRVSFSAYQNDPSLISY